MVTELDSPQAFQLRKNTWERFIGSIARALLHARITRGTRKPLHILAPPRLIKSESLEVGSRMLKASQMMGGHPTSYLPSSNQNSVLK